MSMHWIGVGYNHLIPSEITGFINWVDNVNWPELRIALQWPIQIINPVDKTKLSCYTEGDLFC